MEPGTIAALVFIFGIIGIALLLNRIKPKVKRQVAQTPPSHVRDSQEALKAIEGDFTGKVAIVTGGSAGLGKAMALRLAARGAKVVIASRNRDGKLDAVAAEIEAMGAEVLAYTFDVSKPDQVQAMVDKVIETYGQIDILVNNAAGNFIVPSHELSVNGWNKVIDIVLNGTFYCTSAVGKHMLERGQGSILNIVANYAWSGYPGVVHSAAAKAGVLNMTRTLAVEWGRKGIRVNALAPGTMPSKGAAGNLGFAKAYVQKKVAAAIPLGRLTDSDEMAELGVFLLSDVATYINGECLVADGGMWLPRGMLDIQDF